MIRERVQEILKELPPGVKLEGATKTRTPEEILEAVEAGLTIIGENYVQEAERAVNAFITEVWAVSCCGRAFPGCLDTAWGIGAAGYIS